jgi:TPR repeat protein
MATSKSSGKRDRQHELDHLFQRADKHWDEGKLKSAFRLFLAGAKAGDRSCQLNLGTFYIDGIGVQANRDKALYWYRRGYRRGDACAANNIGIVFRDENKLKRALMWLERAVKMGDTDANLNIAKIHLQLNRRESAKRHLKQVCAARQVTEATRDEAQRLLKSLGDALFDEA